MELVIDFETRSCIDLKKCGMYEYWRSPFTEIMMLSVKEDLNPARMWIPPKFRTLFPTEISDDELEHKMGEAEKVIAHNAGFERQGFKYGMTRLGFSDLPLEKVYCTMAQALMCALPRNLDSVAKIVSGGKFLKDLDGHKLMLKMSKPRGFVKKDGEKYLEELKQKGYLKEGSTWKDVKRIQADYISKIAICPPEEYDLYLMEHFLVYKEDQESFARLVEYARQDTEVERMVFDKLPKIPEMSLQSWRRDQEINDRGVRVHREDAKAIKDSVDAYSENLVNQALSLTGGVVTRMKAPARIKEWLKDNGIETDSIDKEAVQFLLTLDLPEKVKQFLELRLQGGKSSTSKYASLLAHSNSDERFRGVLTWHAASTGRWGGNGPQIQNLPRPSEKNFVRVGKNDTRKEVIADERDIPLLASQDYEMVEFFWKDIMVLAADLIRPMLISAEGKDLICADYSAVEGRGIAWLAGQEDKLDAFRKGLDIYKVAASNIFKIPYEQIDGGGKGPQRQIGKTCELALGFGGSYGAMLRFGADRLGIEEEEGKEIVKAWRRANDKIVAFWYALRDGSLDAMKFPGDRIKVGKVSFRKRGSFLTMRLPSGRDLFYPGAKVELCDMPWINESTGEPDKQRLVTSMVLTAKKAWVRRPLSHVVLSENATQATCRDLTDNGMRVLDENGYPIVFHVHDEAIGEVPEGFGSVEEFEKLFSTLPEWAAGLPLEASGWRGKRYKKD